MYLLAKIVRGGFWVSKYISNNTFSPLSGYEPKYNPKKWNKNKNIKVNHNCYAYALNKLVASRDDKSHPGYFSNFPPLRIDDYVCTSFLQLLKKDIPAEKI